MCGIAGIIGHGWEQFQLESMVQVQNHRGPDDTGMYIDETRQVGLGHNRLTIIDLSKAGHQPMSNNEKTLWIVFNGEVYNYLELKSELNEYNYRSQTDTEVILAAYERWGEDCVDHFIGMFAFAIWDISRQQLFCARDRLGIKPFHYARKDGLFIFASEIKSLLSAGLDASPDWSTWATYLTHGYYDHSSNTFFDGISVLEPGHTLTVRQGRFFTKRYWHLPDRIEEVSDKSESEVVSNFLGLLDDAVKLRLRSDVPIGVNLSGGLDSASLMMTVDKLIPQTGTLQTFTSSFEEEKYSEQDFSSLLCGSIEWKRNFQPLLENEVWDSAWDVLWHQEAPFGGVSTIAYHNLHKMAKNLGVTVLLEGQGVDEMLAGYNYFQGLYIADLLKNRQWLSAKKELQNMEVDKNFRNAIRKTLAGKQTNVYQDGTSHLMPQCISDNLRFEAQTIPVFPTPFPDQLSNALYRDIRFTKLPRVLRMNDRLSMASSRELREPYLDHRIVEYAFSLGGNYKIYKGQTKFLLRKAMSEILPVEINHSSKRPVVTPQREWLRNSLRHQVEEIIYSDSFTQRGLFNPKEVQSSYKRFIEGEGSNSFFVWQWINTEMWFRMFIDNTPYR